MKLDNIDLNKLTGIMEGAAMSVLKGGVRDDHSSWLEDVVQDSTVALLEYEGEVKDVYNLAHTIAHRRALNHQVGEGRRREIEQEYGKSINTGLTGRSAEELAADPFDNMTRDEMEDRLNALSPLIYDTVNKYYIEGWTPYGIAETEGCTVDVVYKRLQRARDIVTGDNNNE